MQRFQYLQINVIYHNSTLKIKNQIIISVYEEKASDKIYHPFIIKTLQKVGTQETYLKIIKAMYVFMTQIIMMV